MGGYFFISTMVYNTMIRIKAMYSIVSTPSKMRRQGFVDGIACAAAFFHRGLCPPYVAEASAAAALKASCSPPQRKAADAIRPAACGTDSGSHTGKPSQNRTYAKKRQDFLPLLV